MKTFKNIFGSLLLIATYTSVLSAQTPSAFQDIYSPLGEQVITATTTTQHQDMVFVGINREVFVQDPSAPNYYLFIRKLDSQGNTVFFRTVDNDCDLYPNSVNLTEDGGFIIAGTVTCNLSNLMTTR